MAQGPINAVLYQPVQPQVGQGEAQVFDTPKTERAVAFMREEGARVRAEERAVARKERQELFDAIDVSLAASANLDTWDRDSEEFGKKYGELMNFTSAQVERLEKGGAEAVKARLEIQRKAAELSKFAEDSQQQMERSKLFAEAIKENEGMYNIETIKDFKRRASTPGEKIPDWLFIPDAPLDVDAAIDTAYEEIPKEEREGFYRPDPTVRNVGVSQQVDWTLDTGKFESWMKNKIDNNPTWFQSILSPYKKDIADGKVDQEEVLDRYIATKAREYEMRTLRDFRNRPVGRGGRGRDEEESVLAETLLADSQRAAASGNPDFLQKYVGGFNYDVTYDEENENFVLQSSKVSASGYQDDPVTVPSDDPEAIARIITDLTNIDPEAVRKGRPASEAEVREMKRRVGAVISEINEIPAESRWSQIDPESLETIGSLEGVEVEKTGLLWNEIVVSIDGDSFDMSKKADRSKATRLLRRKALKAEEIETGGAGDIEDVKKKYNIEY